MIQFAHPEYALALVMALLLALLILTKRFPDVQGCIDLINALSTNGGNILVLSLFTGITFIAGLHYLYWSDGKTGPEFGQGFQWISGGVCGLFAGGLLKTLTSMPMTTATKPGSTITEKTQTTTEKITPPTPEVPPVPPAASE